MFQIYQVSFNDIQKYTVYYQHYSIVPIFLDALCISHQKLSAIVRKHHGCFTKRRIGGDSYITFFKIEDAENCVEELNAILIARELVK